MKFRIGDIVKIKEGLNHKNTSNFINEMEKYCGKVAKITKIDKPWYRLDIDNRKWFWDEYMLEPIQKEYHVIIDGNTITVMDNEGNEGKVEGESNLAKGISLALENMTWKPKEGEDYWTIDLTIDTNTIRYDWFNDNTDKELYRKRLVFRTEEEAKRTADKMLKAIKE